MQRRFGWKARLTGMLVVVLGLVVFANRGYYAGSTYSGNYCTSCHQIQASYDTWTTSAHRNLDCKECHGSAFTTDVEMHRTNFRHLYYQVSGRIPDRVRLKDAQVDRIAANCVRCHAGTAGQFTAGGHSVGYGPIFTSTKHNTRMLVMDDCLRCHGMFVDGNVTTVVAPIDTRGPWTLVQADWQDRPSIPCLACHQMHRAGTPASPPDYADPRGISYQRSAATTTLAFYDRRERRHVPLVDLAVPQMTTKGRAVTMSPDARQAMCYQCHAPEATHEVGTADDRTAIGVHEGIGCLGCHTAHTLDARASCANCHPSQSNCNLDVTRMDTTFSNPVSRHNIHFVSCQDCHPSGVPAKKAASSRPAPAS